MVEQGREDICNPDSLDEFQFPPQKKDWDQFFEELKESFEWIREMIDFEDPSRGVLLPMYRKDSEGKVIESDSWLIRRHRSKKVLFGYLQEPRF